MNIINAANVSLTNCDKEQIHIPGSIQPHGILFVLREPQLNIVQVSQNTEHLIGISPQNLVTQPLINILGQQQTDLIIHSLTEKFEQVNPIKITITSDKKQHLFNAIFHRSADGFILLELEPLASRQDANFFEFYQMTKGTLTKIQNASDLQETCQVIVEEIKALTGFDRVMVYRFDADQSGHVIAERKQDGLSALLGLHYPATDIPKPARQLYKLNWLRLIPDIDYQPVELPPNPETNQAFDLSYSVLRSVSPCHLEYLKNMGVQGSMSISLMENQNFWGLVACHHYSAKYVSYEIRKACEFLAQLMSLQIATIEENHKLDYQQEIKSTQAQIAESLSKTNDWVEWLGENAENLLKLVGAQGAIVWFEGKLTQIGKTPQKLASSQLIQWVKTQINEDKVFYTDSLSKDYPAAAEFTEVASGLLVLEISKIQDHYLLWFRPEVLQSINWAGNPNKDVEVEADGSLKLSPRKSFNLWQETVKHTSLPWKNCEIQAAIELKNTILGIQQALLLEQIQQENRQRRKTEAALEESQARFKGILEIAGEAIISVDESQRIQLFNQGAEAIFGYQETEVLGQSIDILLPGAFRKIHRQHLGNFAASESGTRRMKGRSGEIWGRRKNGETFPAEASISQLRLNTGVLFTVILQDITERKQAEAALAVYQKIVSSSKEAMSFIDRNYIYRAVNPIYEQRFGLPSTAIVGYSVAEILGENIFTTTAKPHLDRALVGEEIHYEQWFSFEQVGQQFLQVSYYPHYESSGTISGVVVSTRDITQRKLAEEALKHQLRHIRLLQQITEQIRKTLDTQEIFQTAALKIGQAFGVNRCIIHSYTATPQPKIPVVAEYLAGDFLSILGQEIPVEGNRHAQQLLAQEEAVISNNVDEEPLLQPIQHLCQQFQIKSTLAVRTSYQEQINGVIGLHQCNRYRQWTSEEILLLEAVAAQLGIALAQAQLLEREQQQLYELQHQNEALELATQAAETANRAKSEFLANMSHEIRTPMNAILGFCELLQKLVTEPRQQSYVQSISSGGKTLLALINDILDLSKIEAGKLELDYETLNLHLLIKEIEQIFRQKANQKGLLLLTDIEETVPTSILFDGIRLRQILFNLVGNALKFTEHGHVKISVRWHWEDKGDKGDKEEKEDKKELITELSHPSPQSLLTIAIEDTGIGIAAEQQQQIFEAFVQSEASISRKYGGTGLGLTITQRLTQLLGGIIEIKSQLGKGSTFTLSFSQVSLADAEGLEGESAEIDENLNQFQAAAILVVDDVQSNLELIEEYFDETHHQLLLTQDGEVAIELAQTHHPDLILLDLWMPNLNGQDVANHLKQQEFTQNIPILILTASIRPEDTELLNPLCQGFLRKPTSQAQLVEALKPILPRIEKAEKVEKVEEIGEATKVEESRIERLAELLKKLQTEEETSWPQLQKTMKRRELREFTGRLKQWASEHHCQILQEYATTLDNQLKKFDWKYLPEKVAQFPQVREALERDG